MKGREAGYAMVVAIAGMMAFAYISLEAVAVNRGAIASVAGQLERARLKAAADAGIALAIHGLGIEDASRRWDIDGTAKTFALGNMLLSVTVEDERGKIPVNRLDEDQVRAMFSAIGMTGNRLDTLVDLRTGRMPTTTRGRTAPKRPIISPSASSRAMARSGQWTN